MDKTKHTPVIEQYLKIKKDYADALVFFRLGDFYELFFDDAITASKILEIVLTRKNAQADIPMCGIPYHAAISYIQKIVEKGLRVVIVDQVGTVGKGLVERQVTKIITPGQIIDSEILDKTSNNFIASINFLQSGYDISYIDISTGECFIQYDIITEDIFEKISDLKIKEVVLSNRFDKTLITNLEKNNILINYYDNFEPIYTSLCKNIDILHKQSAYLLLNYLTLNKAHLSHLIEFVNIDNKNLLCCDNSTKRQLEINKSLTDSKYCLLYYLNDTKTAMGSRMLKHILNNPINNLDILNYRYNLIDVFRDPNINIEITKNIENMYDISRIVSKISYLSVSPKDLYFLKLSLKNIPILKNILQSFNIDILNDLNKKIPDMSNIYNLIDNSIIDNPPQIIVDGEYIKDNYNSNLDNLRSLRDNKNNWLSNYLESQKELTKIKNLKIGYNSIYGHYIDISNSNLQYIKEEFEYREIATLVNSKRFLTLDLKQYSQSVILAKNEIITLEEKLLNEIRQTIKKDVSKLQILANTISNIDVFLSFARVSKKYNYTRPNITNNRDLYLKNARHPVVEQNTNFIKNDVSIKEGNTLIITGPNMGGKSTFMRLCAINIYMAFVGMFVAADSAEIPIYDKIFTRIGSSDDISGGKSTFMVEMLEANYALTKASPKSLILFDEIGRGTSTYDGMALAYAIIEYISKNIKCHTLFSTHYHELTTLSDSNSNILNYYTKAIVSDNNITFLYEVVEGRADRSYGIHVAALAGLPDSLISSANSYLNLIEKENKISISSSKNIEKVEVLVRDLKLENKIRNIDFDNTTPLEALIILQNLKNDIDKG